MALGLILWGYQLSKNLISSSKVAICNKIFNSSFKKGDVKYKNFSRFLPVSYVVINQYFFWFASLKGTSNTDFSILISFWYICIKF